MTNLVEKENLIPESHQKTPEEYLEFYLNLPRRQRIIRLSTISYAIFASVLCETGNLHLWEIEMYDIVVRDPKIPKIVFDDENFQPIKILIREAIASHQETKSSNLTEYFDTIANQINNKPDIIAQIAGELEPNEMRYPFISLLGKDDNIGRMFIEYE